MRRAIFVLEVTIFLAMIPLLSGHAQEPKKELKVPGLMQKKLEHAQKVLEGIAVNDFDKILKGSEELIDISKKAEWRVLKTPQYEVHSNEFRRIADGLQKNARARNLDGAALSYVDLTLTCVKCHKYVREVRDTSFSNDAGGGR